MGVCRLANYKYFYCLNDSSTYSAGRGSLKFQLFPYQVRRLSGLPRIRVLVCALWSFGEPRAVHTQPCLRRFMLGPAAVLHADTGGGGQNTTWPLLPLSLCACGSLPLGRPEGLTCGLLAMRPTPLLHFAETFPFGKYFFLWMLKHIPLWERVVRLSSVQWHSEDVLEKMLMCLKII